MINFDKALAYVLLNEGGYTNDAADSGGPTNWGITIADLAQWRKKTVTADDVKNMPLAEAKAIYSARYWEPLWCDRMNQQAVATAIFDSGVLYGISTSAKYAQLACNACGASLSVDGNIGPHSLIALNLVDAHAFIIAFHSQILARISSIIAARPSQNVFRKGWTARADRLLKLA